MADKSYYKNIGMDATAELNNKDAFGAAVMKAEQMLSQAMDSGQNDATDGAINEFMTRTLEQMYKNGEMGNMPYEEFVQRLKSEPMGYAGQMNEMGPKTRDDNIWNDPSYEGMNDGLGRTPQQQVIHERVVAGPQLTSYAADPDGVADAEMPPKQYQQMMGVRNNMVNGQDPQTDPRLRADLRSQLVANMRGVKR